MICLFTCFCEYLYLILLSNSLNIAASSGQNSVYKQQMSAWRKQDYGRYVFAKQSKPDGQYSILKRI